MPTITIRRQRNNELDIIWDRFNLELHKRTYIMGILNRTPDSFSDGGRFISEEGAVSHGLRMASEGADIIDVGGESTRPGSAPVSAQEEIDRVMPVIKRLRGLVDIPISVDTSKAEVAREALNNGASMVNDITGLRGDSKMAGLVAERGVPIVVMHMKGTPRTMQLKPRYGDLIGEIIGSLKESISIAQTAGIDEEKIITDPGIGFGKTLEHNLVIIKELARFKSLGRPILIGVSRKSFIGQILGKGVTERLMGTASSAALSIYNGANILRVHDVKEMVEVARVADSICRTSH